MGFTTPKINLQKNQYDNLFESTSDNPYLTKSAKASKNKSLNTTSKSIIPAINELKKSSDSLSKTLTNGLAAQNNYLGDFAKDATLLKNFKATGYKSIADGVIALKEDSDKAKSALSQTTKEIVFVFPKVTTTTVFTEIYIPFKSKIQSIDASCSSVDNKNRNSADAEILFTLQHKDNGSATFDAIQSLSIAKGSTYTTTSFTDPVAINEGILKLYINKAPKELKNFSVIVTVIKDL